MPKLTANDITGEIVHWHAAEGEPIAKDAPLVDISVSKAVYTVASPADGRLRRRCRTGDRIAVGDLVAVVGDEPAAPATNDAPSPGTEPAGGARWSAAARQWAQSQGLDPAAMAGEGLVTSRSARRRLAGVPPELARSHREDVSAAKRQEIEALTEGVGALPCTLTVEWDATALYQTLQAHQALQGQVLPVVLYELAQRLPQAPLFTAFYRDGKIYFHDAVHIGVAIDAGDGLRVAVLRDADRLMPIEIHERLTAFGLDYHRGKLTADQMTGSTLTVTDLSGYGITRFQPLLNRRQSVIVGIGGDTVHSRRLLSLNLTFDHRVLSGRDVAVFLRDWKSALLAYAFPR